MLRTSWLALALPCMIATAPALAQWSSNSATNTPVSLDTTDQTIPVIRLAPDGSSWVSYFDGSTGGGLKPTIQRFDACGYPIFAAPVLLANRTNTATFTYDMKLDAAGNAYCVFDNNGIYLQRVNLDGSLPWGAAGILMPGTTGLVGGRLAIAADGTIVVGVGRNATGTNAVNQIMFQRFNADGTLPAGGTWTYDELGRAQLMSDIISAVSGGDVIALWSRNEGTNSVTSRRALKIQRFNASNAGVWNSGVPFDVFVSTGTAPTRGLTSGYFPPLIADGSGGAVIGWYENGSTRNVYLQHFPAAGTPRFPANGLEISSVPVASEIRLSASVGYHAPSESYVIAYGVSNSNQSQFGLAAQRIEWNGSSGTIMWNGGSGSYIYPVGGFQTSFVDLKRTASGDALINWIQYAGTNSPMEIQSARLDTAGAPVWSPAVTIAASNPTTKGRLAVARTAGDASIAVWQDGGAGSVDLYAQLIRDNGALGLCPSDFDCNAVVEIADIFAFLNAWFAGNPRADFNGGGITINDIFDFLNAWFAGC